MKKQPASVHAIIARSLRQSLSPNNPFAAQCERLAASPSDSGPMSLEHKSVHIEEEDSASVSAPPSPFHHVPSLDKLNIVAELEAQCDVCLVDSVRIGQIFGNLFSNASKFTSTGGTLKITSKVIDSLLNDTLTSHPSIDSSVPLPPVSSHHDQYLLITVADNGSGIDPAVLPKLFQPFEQGSVEVTKSHGGIFSL